MEKNTLLASFLAAASHTVLVSVLDGPAAGRISLAGISVIAAAPFEMVLAEGGSNGLQIYASVLTDCDSAVPSCF